MNDFFFAQRVYFYRQTVDMRKSIDGLSMLVIAEMQLDPTMNADFVFIGKSRDKIKILKYDTNGFWLFYKRLIKQRFKWPKSWFETETLELTSEQFIFFLRGCDLEGLKPFKPVKSAHLC